jgi:hypothetical protein
MTGVLKLWLSLIALSAVIGATATPFSGDTAPD